VQLATLAAMEGYRPDAIVIDAPRSFHLCKFIVFWGVEGLLIATGVLAYSGFFSIFAWAAASAYHVVGQQNACGSYVVPA
jgi:hypothetical protein